MDSFFIFMYFPGLSGCGGISCFSSCWDARQKSGFRSIEPCGGGRECVLGGYILPRKCAAGFRGDRLCLLQICHTANGQPGTGCFTNVKEKRAVNKRTSVLREGLPPPSLPFKLKAVTEIRKQGKGERMSPEMHRSYNTSC